MKLVIELDDVDMRRLVSMVNTASACNPGATEWARVADTITDSVKRAECMARHPSNGHPYYDASVKGANVARIGAYVTGRA